MESMLIITVVEHDKHATPQADPEVLHLSPPPPLPPPPLGQADSKGIHKEKPEAGGPTTYTLK